jgi:hypothetical protein
MKYFAVLTTATRRLPRSSPRSASTSCAKDSQDSSMSRAVRASASPVAVSRTRRATTSNSGNPIRPASSFSCIEAVGWVTWQRRAAALTLPSSARARNRRNCRKLACIEKTL